MAAIAPLRGRSSRDVWFVRLPFFPLPSVRPDRPMGELLSFITHLPLPTECLPLPGRGPFLETP